MRLGFNETCLAHDPGPRHPESAERLEAVRERLDDAHDIRWERPDRASVSHIEAVHSSTYVAELDRLCANGGGRLDADTIASERTWDAALASAGLSMWAARESKHASDPQEIPFALGRPPGHHALEDAAMGFCFFNNVAVAAERVIDHGEANCVAVFDWDVHHGNGTQAIFETRADVPFVSIHEDGLYPGSGSLEETGSGDGAGATLNLPLSPGAETAGYLATMNQVVIPWIARHDPDMILVSAGFDAHRHDPISRMAVSTEGYGLMTQAMIDTAADIDARIGFILEGGYGLDTLADGVRMVHDVCSGYDPEPVSEQPREVDEECIAAARSHHGLG